MASPYFLSLPSVLAKLAILATFGLVDLAALAIFLAGIFSPSGTLSARCNAPLCWTAPAIQFFVAIFNSNRCG